MFTWCCKIVECCSLLVQCIKNLGDCAKSCAWLYCVTKVCGLPECCKPVPTPQEQEHAQSKCCLMGDYEQHEDASGAV